jgi:glycosidase
MVLNTLSPDHDSTRPPKRIPHIVPFVRAALLLSLAVLAVGCIDRRPPAKLDAPTPVASAYLLTYPDRPEVDRVPDEVSETFAKMLGSRNLNPADRVDDALLEEFASLRESEDRLRRLADRAGDAPFVFLVETRVRYDTRFIGRQRWEVAVRATFAPTTNLEEADYTDFAIPAFLDFDHQDERDALRYTDTTIADRASRMLDRFLQTDVTARRQPPADDTQDPTDAPPVKTASASKPASPLATREGPPPFDAGDAIYFVMVDRFANGVPENDDSIDPADPQAWHGGDIAGLTSKLDYLDNLGVSHVWVSPVWDARDTPFYGHGAFHGYWTENLAAVEPRLGTEAELVALSNAARERDMGLLLDMVLNHVGPEAPLVAEKPDWFHGNGGITDWNDPKQVTDYDVHGLPDLDQDNPEVYDHLLNTSVKWSAALGPAGFRLDAVKHVSDSFWTRYNTAIAEKFGDDFVMLGEVLDGNPRVTAEAMRTGGFNALFDFPLHFALVDVFCRDAHPGRIGAVLGADRLYPTRLQSGNRRGLVTLLDNHDLPRIVSVCGGDVDRVRHAMTFMLGLRGTPSFTWGTEIPLAGEEEPANRADMRFEADAKLADVMKAGIARRGAHRVLVDGVDHVLELSDDRIVLARVLPDSAAIVAWSSKSSDDVELPEWFADPTQVVSGPVGVWIAKGDFAEQFDSFSAPPTRELIVTVNGAPGPARLAGSAPELGAWSADDSVPFRKGVARVNVPVGQVVALKMLVRDGDDTTWEQRADRFVLIEPGSVPIELALEWEK